MEPTASTILHMRNSYFNAKALVGMFLKLCRIFLAGFSALCGILTLVVLSSCFFDPKLPISSNASENFEAKVIKSASLQPPSTLLEGRRNIQPIRAGHNGGLNYTPPVTPIILRQHMSQTVNWYSINTLLPGQVVEGIYFSVRTTQKNHSIRLSILLLTWMQTVFPSQVSSGWLKLFRMAKIAVFQYYWYFRYTL